MSETERKAKIRDGLMEILDRFTPPRGMSVDVQEKMVEGIVTSLNRKIPITNEETFAGNLERTFNAVLDSHKSYAWPPQGVFAENVSTNGASVSQSQETYEPSAGYNAAERMLAGEPVPERYVWGYESAGLLNRGEVSREVMDSYRFASVKHARDVYKTKAREMTEPRLGYVVARYFD